MFRINEKLRKEGKLEEGHIRILQGWKMTEAEIKEVAGFDIEKEVGTDTWNKAVLTDERKNKVVTTINYAEYVYVEKYEDYKQFICKEVKRIAASYER